MTRLGDTFDSQTLGRRVNELLILAELREAPRHGYQIALSIEERSGGYFPFNHGTLYPILHRLEKDGLIAGEWSDPVAGRARKEYALTEAGRTHVAALEREWAELGARLEAMLGTGGSGGAIRAGAA
jgi:PadR family transcriptional regulator, regulatory protein PadR